jgi:uncharacterized protein YyaL (SSP411 family)
MSHAPNRLAAEVSPYLRQHANNPVDWYPWGPEALERARREDKPILLSIGYSACHWCHVMERESFEDPAIAALMNERFVNIKVDREERPDLDQVYQLVVQLMGKSGGWPLTVFLTPEQRPFFAGTYFPPRDRYGMRSFPWLLAALSEAYGQQRGAVESQAHEVTQAIAMVGCLPSGDGAGSALDPDLLVKVSTTLLARFDDRHGGFGARPKFPNTMGLELLLRRGVRAGGHGALASAKLALDRMREGGVWDHLRGGFHRYSTDERWLVPHFEKMLYDNALLLRLYTEAHRVFGEARYAETVRAMVGYLFAEMRDPGGGFYTSQDADSEGHEGTFFVWTPAELEAAVGKDGLRYDVARAHFGITDEGNFEGGGATVLSAAVPLDQVARQLEITPREAREILAEAADLMLHHRDMRPRPTRDDKVLASWNGLLIGALSDAGMALGEPTWVEAAVKAFCHLEERLVRAGRVGRYQKDGAPRDDRPGFLDDQAYLGNAALDLFEATGDPCFARTATAIGDAMIAHHWDRGDGGFFFSADDAEVLIARTKDARDQAIPSAASMAALLCLRLGEIIDARFAEAGEKQLLRVSAAAIENPLGMGHAVLGLDRLVRGAVTVVLVGEVESVEGKALAESVFKRFVPGREVVRIDPARPESVAAAPLAAEGKSARAGAAVAYVCQGRSCSAPVTTVEELGALLDGLARR